MVLFVNDLPVQEEIAHTEEIRSRGLSHHESLPGSSGMLFIFREPALHAMWMRNTGIPLSVAFLDEHGFIINIEEMEPYTYVIHNADKPAKYALELNRGWFAAHGVKSGMHVKGLDLTPPAR